MFDLKRFRKDNKLTQTDVAFLLGCGQPNIAAIEKNAKSISDSQLSILEEKYGNLNSYITEAPVTEPNINDIINHWIELVEKQQATIDKLLDAIEIEKKEKSKLIESINALTNIITEKKAV